MKLIKKYKIYIDFCIWIKHIELWMNIVPHKLTVSWNILIVHLLIERYNNSDDFISGVCFLLFVYWDPTQHTYHFVDCQSGYCNFTVISLVDFIKQGWLMVIDNTWLLNVYCYNTNECDIIFIYYHIKCCKWYVNWRTYGVWSSFVYLFSWLEFLWHYLSIWNGCEEIK